MIGWVAIGDPAAILPPGTEPSATANASGRSISEDRLRLEKDPARSPVARICESYGRILGEHASDRPVER